MNSPITVSSIGTITWVICCIIAFLIYFSAKNINWIFFACGILLFAFIIKVDCYRIDYNHKLENAKTTNENVLITSLDSQIMEKSHTHTVSLDTYNNYILPLEVKGYVCEFVYDYDFADKYLSKHADCSIDIYAIDEEYKAIFNHTEKTIILIPILPKEFM